MLRPANDLFLFGLVMLYIGSVTSCEEMLRYYATQKTAVCTPDSYIVLRSCRYLFAALLRDYYLSKDFSIFVSVLLNHLDIKGLTKLMRQLLTIAPTGRPTLDDVLKSELFVAAQESSAEQAPLVMQAKRAAQTERERAETLEHMNLQAEAKPSALEKEMSALKAEHQLAVVERNKLKEQWERREKRQQPIHQVRAQSEAELAKREAAHRKEIEQMRVQMSRELAASEEPRTQTERDASKHRQKLEEQSDLVEAAQAAVQLEQQRSKVKILQQEDEMQHFEFLNGSCRWIWRKSGATQPYAMRRSIRTQLRIRLLRLIMIILSSRSIRFRSNLRRPNRTR